MDITSKVSEILVDESSFMVVFRQNKASQVGGAIESRANNVLIFTGTVKFIENSALNGGAIGFLQSFPQSRMVLVPVLNISFISNYATDSGGALYFKDSQCIYWNQTLQNASSPLLIAVLTLILSYFLSIILQDQ